MPPRTQPPERRRADLLDAALQIVVDKGAPALTVDEVTSRAQVAKGTFYLYFRSKEQIISALQERFAADLVAQQRQLLDELPEHDWMARLLTWMETSIRGYLEHADLHGALFHHSDADVRGSAADADSNPHAEFLQGILEAGTDAGIYVGQAEHITIRNSTFTSHATFDGLAISNILFDRNTHNNINSPTGAPNARLGLYWGSSTPSGRPLALSPMPVWRRSGSPPMPRARPVPRCTMPISGG
jgi:AcrR family transcriptional regulator